MNKSPPATDVLPIPSERELAEIARLANLGEITGPVTHELNNFFYSLLLQLAVLEQTAPENARHDVEVVRRQAMQAAEMVRRLQEYRQAPISSPQLIDLNALIRMLVDSSGRSGASDRGQSVRLVLTANAQTVESSDEVPLTLSLDQSLPAVVGYYSDLKRLCLFLMRNLANAASLAKGSVTIHTERLGDKVLLRIDDTGASPTGAMLDDMFEPNHSNREGMNSLELAACRSLVRRLQGSIRAEPAPERGVRISVLLPLQMN
jgi:two-component system NtrC family sensor kinase